MEDIDSMIKKSGFSDKMSKQIKEDYQRFVNFKFASDAGDWKYLYIDGSLFDTDNNYYLHPAQNGFSVQVSRKKNNSCCYDYGILIFIKDDKQKCILYENGHGPFN